MEHVNDWCFRDIYKGGLWEDDLYVCAQLLVAYYHADRIRATSFFIRLGVGFD